MKPSPGILVTGGSGFLGSHLIDELVRRGHRVRVLVRPTSSLSWLSSHIENGCVEPVEGDLRDAGTLGRACAGVKDVFHAAAAVDFRLSAGVFREVNIQGTEALARICMKNRIRRFVYVSSIGASSWSSGALTEDTELESDTEYGASKTESEHRLMRLFRNEKLPLTIVVPSAIYGPRARIVIPEMLWYVQKSWMPLVDGGSHRLNLVHVSDVVQGILLAAGCPEALGRRFLIGHDDSPSFREIFEHLAELLRLTPPRWSVPHCLAATAAELLERLGLLRAPFPLTAYLDFAGRDAVLDISLARKVLGYVPRVGWKEGLEGTVRWFMQHTDLIDVPALCALDAH